VSIKISDSCFSGLENNLFIFRFPKDNGKGKGKVKTVPVLN